MSTTKPNFKFPVLNDIQIPDTYKSMLPPIPPKLMELSTLAQNVYSNISDENVMKIADKINSGIKRAKDNGIAAAGVFADPKVRNIISTAIQKSYNDNLQGQGIDYKYVEVNDENEESEIEQQLRNQVEELLRKNAELKASLDTNRLNCQHNVDTEYSKLRNRKSRKIRKVKSKSRKNRNTGRRFVFGNRK